MKPHARSPLAPYERLQRIGECRDEGVGDGGGMGSRYEIALELRRRDVETTLVESVEDPRVKRRVATLRGLEIPHRPLRAEEREHAAELRHLHRYALPPRAW